MAIHKVLLDLPSREINKVDAHFHIYKNGDKLGTITISKGGLDYYPSNSRKPIKIGWTQFDKMIKEWNES
jgi:hypothetical protein